MQNTIILIDSLKSQGFDVYGPEKLTTYVYFTDGERIGYAQCSKFDGVSYSTVHKPSRLIGTGFSAQDAQAALAHHPHWASNSDVAAVVKYADFESFRRQHWQALTKY